MKQITVLDEITAKTFTFYDNANGIILREFEGFDYPAVREVIEDVSGPMSSVYITSKFGRRRFSWAGDIVDADVFSIRRQMLEPMRQQGTLKLITFTTYDDLALQCYAEIVKVVNPYNHMLHSFLIEAIAPDWRFFSQTEHTNDSADVEQTLNNAGTEETDPIFYIEGPFTSATVANLSTSKEFTIENDGYTDVAAAGEHVKINVATREVLLVDALGDETSIFSDFTGDFFTLIPGDNLIRLTHSEVGAMQSTWWDAYIGL